jgi:hypothetical protein
MDPFSLSFFRLPPAASNFSETYKFIVGKSHDDVVTLTISLSLSLLLSYVSFHFLHTHFCRPFFTKTTCLNVEWQKDWKDIDFEGNLAKLQKEAEERLETKIDELMSNIETSGVSSGN